MDDDRFYYLFIIFDICIIHYLLSMICYLLFLIMYHLFIVYNHDLQMDDKLFPSALRSPRRLAEQRPSQSPCSGVAGCSPCRRDGLAETGGFSWWNHHPRGEMTGKTSWMDAWAIFRTCTYKYFHRDYRIWMYDSPPARWGLLDLC